MKILLIQSYLGNEPLVYPLGLASIAASLSDHTVSVLDLNLHTDPFEELENIIVSFKPDLIGISLRNIDSTNKRKVTFFYKYLAETLSVIKKNCDSTIIIGGSGFSAFAKSIMHENPCIDFGIYLEGEGAFVDLLNNLDNPEKVLSLYIRKNGELVFTGSNSCPLDLNKLPLPNRSIVPQKPYYENNRDALGVETKRGCALECIYCIYGFLNGKQYRFRHPSRVVDDIERLCQSDGAGRFTFVDSVFNTPRRHAEEICHELIRRNLSVKWSAWFSERDFDSDLLQLVQRAGCDHLIFSPDGFTDDSLRALGKSISNKDIVNTFNVICESKGLDISYNFFKNPPGQSFTNFAKTILFFLKAKYRLGKRVHFELSSLRIEPHTKLYQIALDEKIIKKDTNLLYPAYYTQRKTKCIGSFVDLLLYVKSVVSR